MTTTREILIRARGNFSSMVSPTVWDAITSAARGTGHGTSTILRFKNVHGIGNLAAWETKTKRSDVLAAFDKAIERATR